MLTATELLRSLGRDEERIAERTVRYYVQEGVLTRPERQGKEAVYAYRHLLELMVARLMAEDGWPLAKIAEFIGGADEKTLRQFIPERTTRAAPGEPRASLQVDVTGQLQERLARARRLPPHRCAEKIEIDIEGCFTVTFDKDDFQSMTPAEAARYADLLQHVLEHLAGNQK